MATISDQQDEVSISALRLPLTRSTSDTLSTSTCTPDATINPANSSMPATPAISRASTHGPAQSHHVSMIQRNEHGHPLETLSRKYKPQTKEVDNAALLQMPPCKGTAAHARMIERQSAIENDVGEQREEREAVARRVNFLQEKQRLKDVAKGFTR